MNFARILNITRRHLWLFVLVTLVAGLTTYFAIASRPTVYEAKTRLLAGPGMDSPSPDLNALRIGGQLIQTYAEMVSSRPFLESVNSKLDNKVNLEELAATIETRQNTETRILTIFVRHSNPEQAVAIANAIAASLMEVSPSIDNSTSLLRSQLSNQSNQLEQTIANSRANIEELEAKLVALGNVTLPSAEAIQANLEQQSLVLRQLADERSRLSEVLRTLTDIYGVLSDTNANQLQIIEPAGVVYPVDKNVPLRVAAAGLAGLILAVSIIFWSEFNSDTVRFPEDLRRIAKVPQLNVIERHEPLNGNGLERVVTAADPNSRTANSYHTVIAKLLFSIGEAFPQSILLSSVGGPNGEDTAEVAANLGVAFAQAGKRVVLVDAQFHNPELTKMFAAEEKPGLAEFISAGSPKLKLMPVNAVTDVRFLPAGSSTEKSSAMLYNTTKISRLVGELRNEADIVLVAGAPISWFAESLGLAPHMNGVILVARPGETNIKTINEVIENLDSMNIRLLSVIFDENQQSFTFKVKPRNVFESAPVASEDSHV
jgi:capsular polysaccharide biosynthesis protein